MAGEPTQQDKLLAYCRWALLVLLTVVFACLISWCYDVDGDQTNKDFSDPPETQPIEYTITLNQVYDATVTASWTLAVTVITYFLSTISSFSRNYKDYERQFRKLERRIFHLERHVLKSLL
ncbi:hypothetical protein pkur_cds_168 [Pandoravirus kuranda]|uniref:Uncharacterized protein n=1 Tax=Pandoravirus kuranda TaxID=3019033 RepID=A0AA95EGB1_9VIRU|nr:hypothetical protein pkur_cds_168 [Pandoravirus kuranda]